MPCATHQRDNLCPPHFAVLRRQYPQQPLGGAVAKAEVHSLGETGRPLCLCLTEFTRITCDLVLVPGHRGYVVLLTTA